MSKTKKNINRFRVGMVVYILLFFIALIIGMIVFWDFLGVYESSLPIHAMEEYMKTIDPQMYRTIAENEINNFNTIEYEPTDSLKSMVAEAIPDTSDYTFRQSGVKMNEDGTDIYAYTYQILSNKEVIASVTLTPAGKTEKFGRTVWQVSEPTSAFSVSMKPQYSVDLTVADNTSVTINGIPLTAIPTDETDPFTLDDKAANAIGQPKLKHYVIEGFYNPPVVRAQYANGEICNSSKELPDETVAVQSYDFSGSPSELLRAEHSEYMEKLCKAYINYIINKDLATDTNLANLSPYLLQGSNAAVQLSGIFSQIAWNNPYLSREDKVLTTENFIPYGLDCFTVDTHFELVLTQKNTVNDYNGTVRWTMVRTANGWRAADMEIIG